MVDSALRPILAAIFLGAGLLPACDDPPAASPRVSFESRVDLPVNGVEREVIRYATPRRPEGLALKEPFDVPRRSEGEGVVGVRLLSRGDVRATATVGGLEVPTWTGKEAVGQVPLHGPLRLGQGSGGLDGLEVFHHLPQPWETTDFYPFERQVSGEVVVPVSKARAEQVLEAIWLSWGEGSAVPFTVATRWSTGEEKALGGGKSGETRLLKVSTVAPGLRLKIAGEAHLRSLTLRFADPEEPAFALPFEGATGTVEIPLPEELRSRRLGRVEVDGVDGATYHLRADGAPVGEGLAAPDGRVVFSALSGLTAARLVVVAEAPLSAVRVFPTRVVPTDGAAVPEVIPPDR